MLSKSQLDKIKNTLEQSQNPLFFFDNDADGLCSFLILQRALGRGKGVAIKSFPNLDASYIKKVEELNPDLVVVLDKAQANPEFINCLYEKSLPILWIDHHQVEINKDVLEKIEYYNTAPSAEPITYIAYEIFKIKKDMWIAMIGCIGDAYLPSFSKDFAEENPDLFQENISAFNAIYLTEIGKAVRMLNFGLKDTTTNVLNMIRFLTKAKSFYDLYEENPKTRQLHKRCNQLNQEYQKNLKKAESQISKSKLIFFTYSGETSMSQEIANELMFKHPDKIIVVAYKNYQQGKASISLRGNNIRNILLKALEKFKDASGGGHELACGARIPIDQLGDFKKYFENLITDSN